MLALDLVMAPDAASELIAALSEPCEGLEYVPPSPLTDPAILNSAINPESIKNSLELVTLVATTPLAVAMLISKVVGLFKSERSSAEVIVIDSRTGTKIATVHSREHADRLLSQLASAAG